jgi:hypothetical protein
MAVLHLLDFCLRRTMVMSAGISRIGFQGTALFDLPAEPAKASIITSRTSPGLQSTALPSLSNWLRRVWTWSISESTMPIPSVVRSKSSARSRKKSRRAISTASNLSLRSSADLTKPSSIQHLRRSADSRQTRIMSCSCVKNSTSFKIPIIGPTLRAHQTGGASARTREQA